MKIPISWLRQYVKIPISIDNLSSKLTMAGFEVGQILKKKNDSIFDIEITPNRPDLLSILGIAREVSTILEKPLIIPKCKVSSLKTDLGIEVDIKNYTKCPVYTARVIENIKVSNSPSWLKDKILSMGLREVNNIVDITNFSLFETGHPLHAFDYDKINGKRVIIRNAKDGEEIVTIDDKKRKLTKNDLIIADTKGPIAIAGVIGGKATEVSKNTKNIILESAYFDPVSIRKTAMRLGISTESSYRFERGTNLDTLGYSSQRATSLIKNLINQALVGALLKDKDKKYIPKVKTNIKLSLKRLENYLDLKIPKAKVLKILNSLGIKSKINKDVITANIPGFRGDLERDVDLIEEIIRIYGYDKIPSVLPLPQEDDLCNLNKGLSLFEQDIALRDILINSGLNEIISYSLISKESLDNIKYKNIDTIKIKNPLSSQQETLRPSMIPSILDIISSNIKHGQNHLRIFEIGKTYHPNKSSSPIEKDKIVIALSIPEAELFYQLKGIIQAFLIKIGLPNAEFTPASPKDIYYPGAYAELMLGNKKIANLGYILDETCSKFDIANKVALFELDLDKIREHIKLKDFKYKPIIKFPSSYRDISFVIDRGIYSSEIKSTIHAAAEGIVSCVKFLDQYKGKQIPPDKKSLTYRIIYQAKNRTLKYEEVEKSYNKITSSLENKFNIKLR